MENIYVFNMENMVNILFLLHAHLRSNNKGNKRYGNHNVDPHEPAQECKIGCDAGAEMRFDFLDAQLPGYEHCKKAGGFAFPMPPALRKSTKNLRECHRFEFGLLTSYFLIGFHVDYTAKKKERENAVCRHIL